MTGRSRQSGGSGHDYFQGKHRFEHWYIDNQVYFISARCRARFPAFASEEAKAVFWTQFDKYVARSSFTPWVTSLIDNHWHTIGYLKVGEDLKAMMNGIHGATAKLVNDVLQGRVRAGVLKDPRLNEQGRLLPFWRDSKHNNYYDGCLRDEEQGRKTYRYTLTQSQRHRIVGDYRMYPHTRVNVELERAIKRAVQLKAFMEGVPYKRYEDRRGSG